MYNLYIVERIRVPCQAGVSGGIGGICFGYLFDRLKRFKLISTVLVLATATSFAVFTGCLTYGNTIVDVVMICLIGFFIMSLRSTGQNFGGELMLHVASCG